MQGDRLFQLQRQGRNNRQSTDGMGGGGGTQAYQPTQQLSYSKSASNINMKGNNAHGIGQRGGTIQSSMIATGSHNIVAAKPSSKT